MGRRKPRWQFDPLAPVTPSPGGLQGLAKKPDMVPHSLQRFADLNGLEPTDEEVAEARAALAGAPFVKSLERAGVFEDVVRSMARAKVFGTSQAQIRAATAEVRDNKFAKKRTRDRRALQELAQRYGGSVTITFGADLAEMEKDRSDLIRVFLRDGRPTALGVMAGLYYVKPFLAKVTPRLQKHHLIAAYLLAVGLRQWPAGCSPALKKCARRARGEETCARGFCALAAGAVRKLDSNWSTPRPRRK